MKCLNKGAYINYDFVQELSKKELKPQKLNFEQPLNKEETSQDEQEQEQSLMEVVLEDDEKDMERMYEFEFQLRKLQHIEKKTAVARTTIGTPKKLPSSIKQTRENSEQKSKFPKTFLT